MEDAAAEAAHKKRKSGHWLLWWKIEPEELQKQVSEYHTLKVYQSARGIGALCWLLTAVMTAIFAAAKIVGFNAWNFLDVAIAIVFAIFIYRGHRWAMIAATVWWSIEKVDSLVTLFNAPVGQNGGNNLILPIIWWCIYMHAFYLAFKTEQARRAATASAGS
jgi:hypothetical protein